MSCKDLPLPNSLVLADQRDGLYSVTMSYLCASFILKGGRVVRCAPILLGRLPYWRSIAVWECPWPPSGR